MGLFSKIIGVFIAGVVLSACTHQAEDQAGGGGSQINPAGETKAEANGDQALNLPEVEVIEVAMDDYSFSPAEIRVKAGQKVVINLSSLRGSHDFVIDEFQVKSLVLSPGGTEVLEFMVPESAAGQEFEFYCSVGNHRQMGMVGKLIVNN
jgi:plastocyanin